MPVLVSAWRTASRTGLGRHRSPPPLAREPPFQPSARTDGRMRRRHERAARRPHRRSGAAHPDGQAQRPVTRGHDEPMAAGPKGRKPTAHDRLARLEHPADRAPGGAPPGPGPSPEHGPPARGLAGDRQRQLGARGPSGDDPSRKRAARTSWPGRAVGREARAAREPRRRAPQRWWCPGEWNSIRMRTSTGTLIGRCVTVIETESRTAAPWRGGRQGRAAPPPGARRFGRPGSAHRGPARGAGPRTHPRRSPR